MRDYQVWIDNIVPFSGLWSEVLKSAALGASRLISGT